MPGAFADITNVSSGVLDVIANVLETRAAIPTQQAVIKSYLGEIAFSEHFRVLAIGCGTDPIYRVLTSIVNVQEDISIDPSEQLLSKA